MEETNNMLLVVNSLTDIERRQLTNTINSLHTDTPLELHLLYVKPRLPTCYFHIPSMVTLAQQSDTEAKMLLGQIGNMLHVPREHQWIAMGKMKSETDKLAKRLNTSFILISATESERMTRHLGIRRASSGRQYETISGLGTTSFQSAHTLRGFA